MPPSRCAASLIESSESIGAPNRRYPVQLKISLTQANSRHTIVCMVRQVKHDRNKWAFRHGVPYLIKWLNETHDREAKSRISTLLHLCTEALETSWTMSQR